MAILEQSEYTLKYYMGWYGKCHDNVLCSNFNLTESATKEKLFKVFQINKIGDNYSYFDASLADDMDTYQGFTELECGKAYLIVLKSGTEKLDIDNFTATSILDEDELKYVTADCDNQDMLPMSNLSQSSKSLSYYMGWYGVCGEQCEEISLLDQSVRGKIFRVFQINKFNDNYSIFDANYTTQQDDLGLQGFTSLECGNAYLIVLRKGTGELELKDFIGSNIGSEPSGYIIDECLTGPRGIAENVPRIQLKEEDINLSDGKWYDSVEFPKCDADLYNVNLNDQKNSMSVEDISRSCGRSLVFDGQSGGYVNLACYREKPQEVTIDISFTISGHTNNREYGQENQNTQYILFQQNNRTDENNGAFYLKYIEETEKLGRLEIGSSDNDGNNAKVMSPSKSISRKKRYMVHAVYGESSLKLFINGNLIASSSKSRGIDYHPKHTIHLGRKRAISDTLSDSFFYGKLHAFAIYAQELQSDFIFTTYLNERCEPVRGVIYKSCDQTWYPIEHPLFELSVPPTATNRIGVKYKPCESSWSRIEIPSFVLPSATIIPPAVGVKYKPSTGNCDTGGTGTTGIHGTIADPFELPAATNPTHNFANPDQGETPSSYGGSDDYFLP